MPSCFRGKQRGFQVLRKQLVCLLFIDKFLVVESGETGNEPILYMKRMRREKRAHGLAVAWCVHETLRLKILARKEFHVQVSVIPCVDL